MVERPRSERIWAPDSCVVLNGLVRNVRREGGLISPVRQ